MNIFKSKKTELPENMIRIYEKMGRNMEGKKIADEALSYRNLGNFDKALVLLKESLFEYDYTPAMTLIATTLIVQKKFNEGIIWIENCLHKIKESNSIVKIELLANLGVIYFYGLKNYDKALDVYLESLKTQKPDDVDEVAYQFEISNIHRDLAGVYFALGDITKSYRYCQLRLKIVPDCQKTLNLLSHIESNLPLRPDTATEYDKRKKKNA